MSEKIEQQFSNQEEGESVEKHLYHAGDPYRFDLRWVIDEIVKKYDCPVELKYQSGFGMSAGRVRQRHAFLETTANISEEDQKRLGITIPPPYV